MPAPCDYRKAYPHFLFQYYDTPANVLMTPDGAAKITDFGLAQARFLAGERTTSSRAGASVVVPGVGAMTLAYASPEQTAGQPVTGQTDLWSWAVSVLELFVGALTWQSGVVAAEVLEDYLAAGPDNPALPRMPAGMVTLLRHCFQHDPAARPASMQEVAAALQVCYAEVVGQPYPYLAPQPRAASARVWSNRAASLVSLGKPEEALAACEQALRLDPSDASAWANKGNALRKLQRYAEALDAYEQALRLDPTNSEYVLICKAAALRALGRVAEAEQVEAHIRAWRRRA